MKELANSKPTLMPDDGTIEWRTLLAEAVERFEREEVADPNGSARRIVEIAAGLEPTEFALGLDQTATVRGVAQFDSMVARRLEGEPLQYVVGSWGFRTLDLTVDRRVLIPRPETEEVVGWGLEELDRLVGSGSTEPVVVDLGAGSGAIGLSVLAEGPKAQVWLTDSSEEALAVCRANLAALGRRAVNGRIATGSWFEALPRTMVGSIALILSNPPYVATADQLPPVVVDWEPTGALIAGERGTEDVEHLLAGASEWLRADGVIVVEMAPDQVEPMAKLAASKFEEIEIRTDLAGRLRAVIARTPRQGT